MCQKMAKQLGLSKLQSWCTELEEKKTGQQKQG
jgi:hypothetical protein